MTDSISLIMAQISFLEPQLVLIHIPIDLYTLFLQPILQVLFATDSTNEEETVPWTNKHEFLNVSITPEGCSIICSRYMADTYFVPVREQYKTVAERVEIVDETYTVFKVDGQGLDAGQRVLELTSPLAMAGISIFFLTTYFSDFILVPVYARRTVTTALEQRGFVFSQTQDAFVSQLSPALPFVGYHQRHSSSEWTPSPTSSGNMPSTPPAKDLPELQRRTFTKLQRNDIRPVVDRELRLLTCAGNDDDPAASEALKNDLLQVLLSTSSGSLRRKETSKNHTGLNGHHKPAQGDSSASFISITMTATESISIFLEARLIDRLGDSLLGNKSLSSEDVLVPIAFDLHTLPMEATGIVCGVAGCLAVGNTGESKELGDEAQPDGELDITFLSTAKAGIVLVRECDLDRAMAALNFAMKEIEAVEEDLKS